LDIFKRWSSLASRVFLVTQLVEPLEDFGVINQLPRCK
jgi:hypothetical protein